MTLELHRFLEGDAQFLNRRRPFLRAQRSHARRSASCCASVIVAQVASTSHATFSSCQRVPSERTTRKRPSVERRPNSVCTHVNRPVVRGGCARRVRVPLRTRSPADFFPI